MLFTKENKLSEIVFRNLKASAVFERYNLNYSIEGKKTVYDACGKSGMKTRIILKKLEEISNEGYDYLNFHYWSPGFLCDYIECNHHTYIRKIFPVIIKKSKKLLTTGASGKKYFDLILQLNEDFEIHMQKEEKLIFPYIKKLVNYSREVKEFETPPFGTILNPVKVMLKEHSAADENLKILKTGLSENLSQKAHEEEKEIVKLINEFIKDFHLHINFENNLLFPKAVALEKKLKNNFYKS